MPLEVQAAPELVVTAKETPQAQRAAYARGKQAAQRNDAEGAVEAWADVLTATPESIENRRFRMNLVVDTIYVALDADVRQPNRPLLERALDIYSSDRGPATKGEGTGLLIAGGVTMGIGAGLTSLIALGAINGKQTREDLEDPAYSPEQHSRIDAEGEKANTMFIAGLVSAPVMLATGAVLVGIGAKRHIYSRRAYAKLIPSVSRSFAGVQLHGRFIGSRAVRATSARDANLDTV